MINKIEIENYKQFDKLEVKGLKKINFFVGQNDCGKTSLLEALILNLDIKPNILKYILEKRDLKYYNVNSNHIFRNFDYENKIKINTYIDNNIKSNLEIKQKSEIKNEEIFSKKDFISKLKKESENEPLVYSYAQKNKIGDFVYFEDELDLAIKETMRDTLYKYNIPFITKNYDGAMTLNKIIDKNKNTTVDKYANIFNKKILNVLPTTKGEEIREGTISFQVEGIANRVRIEMMGDGIKKYLAIILEIVNNDSKYIMVDEFENGLHPSSIEGLIEAILELSSQTDLQMFFTTHSYDALKKLYEVANKDKYKNMKDDIAIINISNTSRAGFQSYNYTVDGVHNLFENDNDVRE